jgi:hypothetical protein
VLGGFFQILPQILDQRKSELTDVTPSAHFDESERGATGLGFDPVPLEANRRTVDICPDSHFALRAGIPLLGWPPLEFLRG